MIRKYIIRIFFIYLTIFASNTLANEQKAQEISLLTANAVYDFDNKRLPIILKPYLNKNKTIKALFITENISEDIVVKYYLKDNKAIFNKAIPKKLKLLTSAEMLIKYNDEVVGKVTIYHENIEQSKLNLTREEKDWIKKNPIINVSNEEDWVPFDFSENGVAQGYSIDIINLLAKKIGIKIKYINGYKWNQLIQKFETGSIDMMHAFSKTTSRLKKYNYSESYMQSKYVYIIKKNSTNIKSTKSFAGKKIASGKGWASTEILKQKYPNSIIKEYESTLEMLNAVSYGEVDIAVEDIASASFSMTKNFITNLDFGGEINLTTKQNDANFYFATAKDKPELIQIFNKALHSLTIDEKLKLKHKWFGSQNIKKVKLSKDEQKWLKENPISKVAVMNYWPHNNDGDSFHTEVLKLINKYTGTNIIPVKFDAWSEGFSLAKEGNDLHGIMGLSYSKEREEKYFTYSSAYNFTPSYIIVKDTNNDIIQLKDLDNKTIYLKNHSITHKMVKKEIKNAKIIDISTVEQMYKKLSTNQDVDAIISYFINKEDLEKYNLKIAKTIYDRYGDVSIGIHHQYPYLSSILNKAFENIPKEELSAIRDKRWNTTKNTDKFSFTPEQKEYLKKRKQIKICTNPNWAPIEFTQNNIAQGISIDILHLIQDKLNLKYKYIKTKSWKESQEFLKQKKCDILPTAIKTSKREKYANFTKPYLNYDLAIVTKNDQSLSQDINSLLDKTMSRKEGSGLITKINKKYPSIKIKETKDMKSSFESVIQDDVYFTIATLPVLQYYKSKYGLNDLQVSGYTKMKYNLRMAVRDDDKILCNILDISLDNLSQQTHKIIQDKWASTKVVKQTNWTLVFQILGIVLLAFMFVLYNNRKLQRMVKEKTTNIAKQKDELELMISSFDKNVIFSRTDTKGIITHASNAFCEISGYTLDELVGKSHSIIHHPDTPKKLFEDIWLSLKNGTSLKVEIKNIRKDGSFYWLDTKFEIDYDSTGNIVGYSALRVDITNKKAVEDLTANLEVKIQERTTDLSKAKKEVESIHKHTRESIQYASLIQSSILPDHLIFKNFFKDYFAIWYPKDTVGGDVYLFNQLRDEDECLLMYIDCTGHGVPGAFVTMLVKAVEMQIITEIMNKPDMDVSPAWIMGYFNKTLKKLLKQETKDSLSNVGWDGGIIYYNKKTQILKFAGAETPLFYVDNEKEFHTVKGNRYSVGYKKCDADYEYKETILNVKEGMKFYCTTDGYLDQNGGEKDFPFGKRRFGNIIKEYHEETMADQQTVFIYDMMDYENMVVDNERNDDMTVIAFEI